MKSKTFQPTSTEVIDANRLNALEVSLARLQSELNYARELLGLLKEDK